MRLKTAIVINLIIWYFPGKYYPKTYLVFLFLIFFLFYATVDQFQFLTQILVAITQLPLVIQEPTMLSQPLPKSTYLALGVQGQLGGVQVVTVEAGRARLPVAAGTGAQRLRVVETHVHRVAHLKMVQDYRIEMSAFTQRVSKFVFAPKA